MTPDNNLSALPEPPVEADVSLGGFERIDMPIDWLTEDWALELSVSALGAMFRLFTASLRQSPAGSLPGDEALIASLVPGDLPLDVLADVLPLWPLCSDRRRYWFRGVPCIEEAWSRKRGKATKDATRKRRERLKALLVRCGCTETGAASSDVQALVMAEIADGERMTERAVFDAATRAGVIGAPARMARLAKGGAE